MPNILTLKKITYSIALISAIFTLSACSTKKNTAATRGYHQMTTMYNIYFNGNIAFKEGMKNIENSNQDDFSRILPMYLISNKENVNKATAEMDKTIEKCRKSIKKHSITKKPKRNKNKWKDPKYQAFYKQNEFVKGVKRSWITLGMAEIHKGDFIGAVGTFSYIIRNYSPDHYISTEARIWLARAYAEMGWIYEAEDAFSKIKENDVPRKLTGFYSATKADILMKQGKYTEAYPFITVAAKDEKNKTQRTRLNYILGQIALKNNNKPQAEEHFAKVKKAAPPYIMDFNTRLNLFSAMSNKKAKAVKGLNKMANHPNNLEYLDQVYHTLGDVYIANNDTAKALEAYKTGATKSTRNGKDKAALLITTGDIYLKQKNYVDAFPCFQEAATLIDISHPDYRRVERLGNTLGEVALHYNMVVLQDSLQALSKLPKEDQLKIIDQVIKDLIAEEKEAARLAKESEDMANTLSRRASNSNPMAPPGAFGSNSKEWYFYNDNIKKSGFAQFNQKWGKRPVEDNWRRSNKSTSPFSNETQNENTTELSLDNNDSAGGKSLDNDNKKQTSSDNKNPLFYLAQIPSSPEDINLSNKQIANALYTLGEIYSTKLEDYVAALYAYQDFEARFANDSLILEVYYACYRLSAQINDEHEQRYYKKQIIDKFPKSTYAQMLSQPDYIDRMKRMFDEQDSIYEATYAEYTKGNMNVVMQNYAQMKTKYPLSELMPKFALLNALCIGRTGSDSQMFDALTEITTNYPNSDVAPMCKDILALMNQGKDAQKGKADSSLADKRQQAANEITATDSTNILEFSNNEKTDYCIYIVPKNNADSTLNKLLYNIALFNFTKFLVKDYDIAKDKIDKQNGIRIAGMTNLEEAQWYEQMLLEEPSLQGIVTLDVCNRIIISIENLNAITKGLTLKEYLKFITKQTPQD